MSTLPNTLGRAPTSPRLTAALIEPGTQYSDRLNQIDLRLAKSVRVGGSRIQGTVSAFNLLNENTPLTLNYVYGSSWLTPTKILQGRFVKFGVQVDF